MEKICKYIVLLYCLIFMTSCYDLDRFPQQQLSTETFWQNDEQAKEAMMGCYQTML